MSSDGVCDCAHGTCVSDTKAVRPALIIDCDNSDLEIGDTFFFGDSNFRIVTRTRALCEGCIGQCTFREDVKGARIEDYAKSDVKKFVDAWYKEQISKFPVRETCVSESKDQGTKFYTLEDVADILHAFLLDSLYTCTSLGEVPGELKKSY